MTETTPLNAGQDYYYVEDDNDKLFETINSNKKLKYSLYGLCFVLVGSLLYLFAFILPDMYIPKAQMLPDLVQVGHVGVYLTPIDEASKSPEETSVGAKSVERIILIGDIHGSFKQLSRLLEKLEFDSTNDHIVLLGDFISKGPHSLEVLDWAIENDVGCIIGNHEYYVLNKYTQYHNLPSPNFISNITETEFSAMAQYNDDPEYLLAKKLHPKHIDYISQCPLIMELGPVPLHKEGAKLNKYKTSQGVAVHGGLRWDIGLEEQLPEEVLEMRSYLEPFYNETTDNPRAEGSVSWSKVWNIKQEERAPEDQRVVYYGHDAHRGLKLRKYSKGLDTGCFKGQRLTAMVLTAELIKGEVVYRDDIVSVRC